MIGSVLCPVDFSPFSERSLRFGGAFAAWFGAQLTALWVQSSGWQRHGVTDTLDVSDDKLESFTTTVLGPGSVQLLTAAGPVVHQILRAAARMDLIVMGTHGAAGIERLLIGSVAEKVLRRAACPVITVPRLAPDPAGGITLGTILCAIDFSPSSALALRYASSFAERAHGRLLLLHALEWFAEEDEDAAPDAEGTTFPTSEQDAFAQLEELVPADARSQYDAETDTQEGPEGCSGLNTPQTRHPDSSTSSARPAPPRRRRGGRWSRRVWSHAGSEMNRSRA
jgi:nucleotide-binding universal stress UspA family protein